MKQVDLILTHTEIYNDEKLWQGAFLCGDRVAFKASLKTAKAISQALFEDGCMGSCVKVCVELDSIIKELEESPEEGTD